MVAAMPRQTKKNRHNPKSKCIQLPSCGAVESVTPTQRQNVNSRPVPFNHTREKHSTQRPQKRFVKAFNTAKTKTFPYVYRENLPQM